MDVLPGTVWYGTMVTLPWVTGMGHSTDPPQGTMRAPTLVRRRVARTSRAQNPPRGAGATSGGAIVRPPLMSAAPMLTRTPGTVPPILRSVAELYRNRNDHPVPSSTGRLVACAGLDGTTAAAVAASRATSDPTARRHPKRNLMATSLTTRR